MNVESMKEMGSPEEMGPGRSQRNYPVQERRRLLRLSSGSARIGEYRSQRCRIG